MSNYTIAVGWSGKDALADTDPGKVISGADFNTDEFDVHVVPVRYSFGKKGYIDKVSQSPKEFYEELKVNPLHPKTSQPTPGDFRRQYQFLSRDFQQLSQARRV